MLYNNNWTFDRKICCVLQAFLLTFDLRDTRIKIVIAAIGGRILEWVGITVTRRKSGHNSQNGIQKSAILGPPKISKENFENDLN